MRAAALFALVTGAFGQFQLLSPPGQLSTTTTQICVHPTFLHCQASFNNALNLTTTLDWTDPNTMGSQLSGFYLKGVNGLIQVCNARQQFAACLGNMYSACMSVPRFVSDGEDPTSAFQYVELFKELEFDCSGGFVQMTENYDCILSVWNQHQPDMLGCVAAFNKTMSADPSQYCQAVYTVEQCTRGFFQSSCGAEASWWQCERTRIGAGLDQFCPTNHCQVQQSSPSSHLRENRAEALVQIMKGSDGRNNVMKKFAEKARRRQVE